MTIVRHAASDWLNRRAPEENLIPYDEEQYADIISINQAEGELVSEERKQQGGVFTSQSNRRRTS